MVNLTNGVVGTKGTAGAGFTADDLSKRAWQWLVSLHAGRHHGLIDGGILELRACHWGREHDLFRRRRLRHLPLGRSTRSRILPQFLHPHNHSLSTRAADVLEVPVTMVSTDGILEFAYADGVTQLVLPRVNMVRIDSTDNSNRLRNLMQPSSANDCKSRRPHNAVGVAGLVLSGVTQKVASRVATNDFQFASNGTLGTPDVSGTALSDIVTARFGGIAWDECDLRIPPPRCYIWPSAQRRRASSGDNVTKGQRALIGWTSALLLGSNLACALCRGLRSACADIYRGPVQITVQFTRRPKRGKPLRHDNQRTPSRRRSLRQRASDDPA